MDSTIISVIVAAWQRVNAAGGEVTLRNVPLAQRHLLEIAGVSTVLQLEGADGNAP